MITVRKIVTFFKRYKFTILDRYMLTSFIVTILFSCFFFAFLIILAEVVEKLRTLGSSVDIWIWLWGNINRIPYNMMMVLPFSCLFATIFALIKKRMEVVAMISTGVSIRRIMFYPILFVLLLYITEISFLMDNFVYKTYQNSNYYLDLARNWVSSRDAKYRNQYSQHNFIIQGDNNLFYIVGYYDALEKTMENITIIQYNKNMNKVLEDNIAVTLPDSLEEVDLLKNYQIMRPYHDQMKSFISFKLKAKKAKWNSYLDIWVFDKVVLYMTADEDQLRIDELDTYVSLEIIEKPKYFEKKTKQVTFLPKNDALNKIEQAKALHIPYKKNLANYYGRYTYSLSIIFVVFLGIGVINISNRNLSVIYTLLFGMGVFLAHFICYSIGMSLAGAEILPPIIGSCFGTIILAIISIYLFKKVVT